MEGIEKNVDGELTEYRVQGGVRVEDYVTCIHEFYTTGSVTRNVLWDLTEADVEHLGPEDIRKLARAPEGVTRDRDGGKTAIVAPPDLSFGRARIYEFTANLEDVGIELRVFRSRADALQWLASDKQASTERGAS